MAFSLTHNHLVAWGAIPPTPNPKGEASRKKAPQEKPQLVKKGPCMLEGQGWRLARKVKREMKGGCFVAVEGEGGLGRGRIVEGGWEKRVAAAEGGM